MACSIFSSIVIVPGINPQELDSWILDEDKCGRCVLQWFTSMVLECFTVSIIALFLAKHRCSASESFLTQCSRILYHLASVAIRGQQAYNFDTYCHTKILPWRYVRGRYLFHLLPSLRKSGDFPFSWPNIPCGFQGHFCESKYSIAPSISMEFHQSSL